MNCPLCDAQKESYRVVYQNEHAFVVVNIEPLKHGHLIIMPIRHAEQLSDLTPVEAEAFLKTIDRCMGAIGQVTEESPMCLVNGPQHRSQSHLHAHVLPSRHGLRGLFSAAEGCEHRKRVDEETLARMAEDVKRFF